MITQVPCLHPFSQTDALLPLSLQWDVERTRIPVSSVLVGGGVIAAVSTYFGQKWWTKRHAGLITDFVDDMVRPLLYLIRLEGKWAC